MNTILLHFKPTATISPTDRVIDFGKHKGKMLGTLPSTYLKWVSNNLRTRDFHHWANLADQVLHHPLYQDRLEWEQAERILTGNHASSSSLTSQINPAQELAQLSETFGWDYGDKDGWSRVDFGLLGTSKTGRIPRIGSGKIGGGMRNMEKREKNGSFGEGRERRRMRRERLKMKGITEISDANKGSFGKEEAEVVGDEGPTVDNRHHRNSPPVTPFPGRQGLLKKVLDRKFSL